MHAAEIYAYLNPGSVLVDPTALRAIGSISINQMRVSNFAT